MWENYIRIPSWSSFQVYTNSHEYQYLPILCVIYQFFWYIRLVILCIETLEYNRCNVAFKNTSDVPFLFRILRIYAKKDFIPHEKFNFVVQWYGMKIVFTTAFYSTVNKFLKINLIRCEKIKHQGFQCSSSIKMYNLEKGGYLAI